MGTMQTFEAFSNQELAAEIQVVRQELSALDQERLHFFASLATTKAAERKRALEKYGTEYNEKRQAIETKFNNNQRVRAVAAVRAKYQKTRAKILNDYLTGSEKNFSELLEKLTFQIE